MSEKPQQEEPSYGVEHVDPPYRPNYKRPVLSHEPAPAEPKAQQQLLALLGTNAAVVAMCCLLAAVVVIVIVLLALKM